MTPALAVFGSVAIVADGAGVAGAATGHGILDLLVPGCFSIAVAIIGLVGVLLSRHKERAADDEDVSLATRVAVVEANVASLRDRINDLADEIHGRRRR